MIKINRFAVGNANEAFVISDFSDGINIIHSDDNNKGKTIVTQGIMYALGNIPFFPKGFENYTDYYFVVELIKDSISFLICRKKDSFVVVKDETVNVFETVSEFKVFFNDNIYALPVIEKDGSFYAVDPSLFFEMTFLPQDNRKTSNLFNAGRYNKEDLLKAIYSLANCGGSEMSPEEISRIKSEIKRIKSERSKLQKIVDSVSKKASGIDYAMYSTNKKMLDSKFKYIEKIRDEIVSLTNERNRLSNRKVKSEILLAEINSLNRELSVGKLVCSDCGSDNISYQSQNNGVKFDVTDLDTRTQIITIIQKRIAMLSDGIAEVDAKLGIKREELSLAMSDDNIDLSNYLLYKNEVTDLKDLDSRIKEIDSEIADKNSLLEANDQTVAGVKEKQAEVYSKIVKEMNAFYASVDVNDPLIIDDVFTKNTINYSGSQGAVFLMSRLYSYNKVLNLGFPLIIDHFRSGELSTIKEDITIKLFSELGCQVLLTCTLKTQENTKYNGIDGVNSISFDYIPSFCLMNNDALYEFKNMLLKAMIKL